MGTSKRGVTDKCKDCAHNSKSYATGCDILKERPKGCICWAKMTEAELKIAEMEIEFYKDKANIL